MGGDGVTWDSVLAQFPNAHHGEARGTCCCCSFVPFGLLAELWITFYTCLSTTWPTKRDMSAQGLLSSVFSCSPSPKTISKRRLRQTRSLDPALMRYYGTEAEETSFKVSDLMVSLMMMILLLSWNVINYIQKPCFTKANCTEQLSTWFRSQWQYL